MNSDQTAASQQKSHKPKVIIQISGGLVQGVYSDTDLELQVFDLDMPSFATEAEVEERKKLLEEFDATIGHLNSVY